MKGKSLKAARAASEQAERIVADAKLKARAAKAALKAAKKTLKAADKAVKRARKKARGARKELEGALDRRRHEPASRPPAKKAMRPKPRRKKKPFATPSTVKEVAPALDSGASSDGIPE